MVELFVEHEVFPAGALSALVGSTGDLLDHVGRQDVIAFTGSSATGAKIAGHPAVVRNNVRVNIEADSLNAAVLGPDVEQGSATWDLFLAEVVTDMTQKAGQKCTAIRRILVPTDLMEAVAEDLHSDLLGRKTGNPALREVTVGPLATASQLEDIRAGIDRLLSVTKRVGEADTDLVDVQGDGGFFVQPVLLQAADARAATAVHEHEVFGPVATLLPYDGSAADAVDIVRLGDGGLVTSVYSDREDFLAKMIFGLAPYHGRIHLGGKKIAEHSPGPGTVLPQMVHGGPGRAGSGEELGGLRGLSFYMQRTGVQGTAPILERLLGSK
jgi:oxepin-CoA hydrolase/3-oxo-5,6-dehydrosuberyl-CoA semialdehyde dehydrogenase